MKKMLVQGLKKIIFIRTFEELLAENFKKNNNSSFLHLSIGQEASAAGVCLALSKNDLVFGNHRSHGHYLAKGGDPNKMIFEIFGDVRGCCKGFGGSMHMLDRKIGFVGTTPILGSVPPIIAGISMSLKLKKKNNIAVGFLGDGSAEEGTFYETVNIACVHKLPLLIVIEDNGYSVEISRNYRKSKNYNYKNIIEGIGAYYSNIDGQDFDKIYQEVMQLKKKIIKFKNPAVLHLNVLRKFSHSGSDIDIEKKYRVENKKIHFLKDPIKILKKRLINISKYSELELNRMEVKMKIEAEKVFNKAFNKIRFFYQ
jgi:pyruvate dehydrogenase E1 component alpha subunit